MNNRIVARAIGLVVISSAIIVHSATPSDSSEPNYKGKALSEWAAELEQFDQDDGGFTPPAGAEAVIALREIGSNAVPCLLKWLSMYDAADAHTPIPSFDKVVEVFTVLGAAADSAVPELLRIANTAARSIASATNGAAQISRNQGVFDLSLESLASVGPKAVPAMVGLATNLESHELRVQVIKRFGDLGTNGISAAPALQIWFHDKNVEVREAALSSLVGIGKEPDTVLPVLLARLKDPEKREDAVYMLADYGKSARPAIPDLIKLLDDTEWRTRGAIILALGMIGEQPDTTLPALSKQLRDKDSGIRMMAASALGDFGGKAAFDLLLTATDDIDDLVCEEVFKSLRKIDPKALEKTGKKQRPKMIRPMRLPLIGRYNDEFPILC
jgi:HEAT repeat protein